MYLSTSSSDVSGDFFLFSMKKNEKEKKKLYTQYTVPLIYIWTGKFLVKFLVKNGALARDTIKSKFFNAME